MTAPQVIAGRYRLEERLGAGGMGVVWRATDLELERTVAVKRSLGGDDAQIQREARLGAALQHPNIVAVYDSVVDGADRWLVMEYLPARSLAEVVRSDGVLRPEQAAAAGAQIGAALAAMHARDLVHRDLSPSNILVAADGTAKLADLGISRGQEATLTDSARVGGTAGYLAPEVANGHAATAASDVFSLGATLFAAVEGTSPWGSGENGPYSQLRRAAEGATDPLRNAGSLGPALTAMLSQEPERRPSAMEAAELLNGGPVSQTPPRRHKRRPLLVAGSALAALVVLAGGLLLVTRKDAPSAGAAGSTPAAADLVGDPRTADPCSLLSPNSLSQYGKVSLEPNLGHFSRCDLNTNLPADGSTVVTSLELLEPDEYPQVPPERGKLSGIARPNPDPARCYRYFVLPNLDRVRVATERADHKPSGQLCAMADAVVGDAHARVASGPIARRERPFQPASLARLNACDLVDAATLRKATGLAGYPTDRYFADWACSWGKDSASVDLSFDRQWPLAGDPPEGQTPTTIGGRAAWVDPHESDGNACDVTIVYRTYPPDVPPMKGVPAQRDELVLVEYTADAHQGNLDAICATAKSVAAAVAARLPKA